ncbi:DUF2092 domain-containing protein [Mesorhizobium sp. M6A.T.Cr.TU.014.01.1.1]|nr:DUF2092 domain-containing protein [Mesorhizobium sp. M6A.T.Cr.TU.014.01.1.1]RWP75045.1 MAG: DUF2092 domain-containing protein [Mesorhizobium sp.]RWP99158.1 MAG: DUF2092 domain-containing protein [Mesorhizobium sp.]RWQ04909.1 MAG: DUF2092 domain-containing protein [Mesorhizobium sp.]
MRSPHRGLRSTDARRDATQACCQLGGVPREYLAFRNPDTDRQIWIKEGPEPVERQIRERFAHTSPARPTSMATMPI